MQWIARRRRFFLLWSVFLLFRNMFFFRNPSKKNAYRGLSRLPPACPSPLPLFFLIPPSPAASLPSLFLTSPQPPSLFLTPAPSLPATPVTRAPPHPGPPSKSSCHPGPPCPGGPGVTRAVYNTGLVAVSVQRVALQFRNNFIPVIIIHNLRAPKLYLFPFNVIHADVRF